jgi:hypothetical protein
VLLVDEDEILAALAEQLASFPDYVGSENVVSLLDLLEVCQAQVELS